MIRNTTAFTLVAILAAGCGGPQPGSPAYHAAKLQGLGVRNMVLDDSLTLMTAGQLTEEQLGSLPEIGFDRFVCLRKASEKGTGWEEKFARARGLHFVRLPIDGAAGITPPNAAKLADEIRASRGEEASTVLYCGSSNRVGALLALVAHFSNGATPEAALARGKRHGLTRLEPVVREALGLGAASAKK